MCGDKLLAATLGFPPIWSLSDSFYRFPPSRGDGWAVLACARCTRGCAWRLLIMAEPSSLLALLSDSNSGGPLLSSSSILCSISFACASAYFNRPPCGPPAGKGLSHRARPSSPFSTDGSTVGTHSLGHQRATRPTRKPRSQGAAPHRRDPGADGEMFFGLFFCKHLSWFCDFRSICGNTREIHAPRCVLLQWRRPTSSPRASSLSGPEPHPGGPQHGPPRGEKGRVPGAHANAGRPG